MTFDISILIAIAGALVLVTNIITEVIKKSIQNFPSQITATVVAMVITVCAFFAYTSINNIEFQWYMPITAVIAGFFVSYGAQFGFDKLKEAINHFGKKD